jgi:hypothetical protein
MLVTVKCTKCDWAKYDQDPLDWWKKPCPECKAKYIIDRKDMDNYRAMVMSKDAGHISEITDQDDNVMGMKVAYNEDDLTKENSFTCFKCGKKFPLMLQSPGTKNCCFMCDMEKYINDKK